MQMDKPKTHTFRHISRCKCSVGGMKTMKLRHLGFKSGLRCSFLPGASMCVCRRGRYGEGWGRGMDETSWVWRGYQWGLSSSKAVSNSIRICSNQKPQQEFSILLTTATDLGGFYEVSTVLIIPSANVLAPKWCTSCFVSKKHRR